MSQPNVSVIMYALPKMCTRGGRTMNQMSATGFLMQPIEQQQALWLRSGVDWQGRIRGQISLTLTIEDLHCFQLSSLALGMP